jgi:hypothetical protein
MFILFSSLKKLLLSELNLITLKQKSKDLGIVVYKKNKIDLVEIIIKTIAVKKIQQFVKKYCIKPYQILKSTLYILSFDIGIKNLAYCLLNEYKQIIDWNVCDISGKTYDKICQKMITILDQIICPNETIVIIENQPGLNPKMRVISGQVFMYFSIRKRDQLGVKRVTYYSPKNKLKLVSQFNDIPEKQYSTGYQYRKYLSKECCKRLIKDPYWVKYFNQSKKKDDLSDSYLQGIVYLN